MTKHQAHRTDRILDAVEAFITEYGHPPSVRDLMPMVELASPAAVHYHLQAMERDGRIVRCRCGCQRPYPVAL